MDETSQRIEEETTRARLGRPWWMACLIGCLFTGVGLFAGGFALFDMMFGSPVHTLTALPSGFPKDVTFFHLADARTITFVAGKDRGKYVKLLTGPMKVLNLAVGNGTSTVPPDAFNQRIDQTVKNVEMINLVTVDWGHTSSSKKEVLKYYRDEMKQIGMTVTEEKDDASGVSQIQGLRENISFLIDVTTAPGKDSGVDQITAVVQYP